MTKPQPHVAVDVVASGSDPARDAPSRIAAIRYVAGRSEETLSIEVQPLVDGAPGRGEPGSRQPVPIHEALDLFAAFLGRHLPVAHGWRRHASLLARFGPAPPAGVDTAELARTLLPGAPSVELADLVAWLEAGGADLASPLGRAAATHALFETLLRRTRDLPPTTIDALVRLADDSEWDLGPAFRRARRLPGRKESATPPEAAAPEPLRPEPRIRTIDARSIEALIGPGGALSETMTSFEDRAQQRRMLRDVADALNRGDQLLVEAGTGTGKSLAYLLPAAAWARENSSPVVVATHTLTLQDQLWTHDVPLASALLGGGIAACLLKGRVNYLCRSRLEQQLGRADLDRLDAPVLGRVLVWASRTGTGDRAELGLSADEEHVWRTVCSEGDACTADRCTYAAAGACWVQRARARAEASHVIIVNHALLVSDMMVDNRLLPRHQALIVDEAHHLEDVATEALGFTVGHRHVRDALSALAGEGRRGVLDRIAATAGAGLEPDAAEALRDATTILRAQVRETAMAGDTLLEALEAFLARSGAAEATEVRLTSATRVQPDWLLVETAWQPFDTAARALRRGLGRLAQALAVVERRMEGGVAIAADLVLAVRTLTAVTTGLERALVGATAEDIVWARRNRAGRPTLGLAPLCVADTLALRLFADKEALVLTSATLRANAGFDFLRGRLGLPDAPGEAIESPFDYARAVLVLVPNDLPDPNQPGYQEAIDSILAALAMALGGRTLVLYTSHSGLQATYHRLRAPLGAAGIAVRGQGLDGDRHQLVRRFRTRDARTLLLGTRSFWEGIDVPGEALSCLAIARLPFDVPADPVFAARAETFEDAFGQYALPRAVLRFRQGFGRLIRGSADRGVFVVLDGRVLHRGYGPSFLEALPPCRRVVTSAATVPLLARKFLDCRDPYPESG